MNAHLGCDGLKSRLAICHLLCDLDVIGFGQPN